MPEPENAPTKEAVIGDYWKLSYRLHNKMYSLEFKKAGNQTDAIALGRSYCERKRIAFINVEPLFFDLEKELESFRKTEELPIRDRPGGHVY
jgi:hypothetical protein